jgi:hypothetical protein
MSRAAIIATAAVVGAIAGVAGGVLALNVSGSRNPATLPVTILLTAQGPSECDVRTVPHGVVAGERDVIKWNIVGNCSGIDTAKVELQYVGSCDGPKQAPATWTIFTDNSNPRGNNARRTIATDRAQCVRYRVWYVDRELEDPEIEIVQF